MPHIHHNEGLLWQRRRFYEQINDLTGKARCLRITPCKATIGDSVANATLLIKDCYDSTPKEIPHERQSDTPTRALIHQKVDSGLYNNASEVVREALRLMVARDQFERTRAAITVGLQEVERGEDTPWTSTSFQELLREAAEDERRGVPINDDVRP